MDACSSHSTSTGLIGKIKIEENLETKTKVAKQDMRLSDGRRVTITLVVRSDQDPQNKMEEVARYINELSCHVLARLPPSKPQTLQTYLGRAFPPPWDTTKDKITQLEKENIQLSFIIHPNAPKKDRTIHFEPDKMDHLFLKESPKFFEQFLNKLAIRYPEHETEINELKERGSRAVEETYDHNFQKTLPREEAVKQWGTKEEKQRQKEVSTALNKNIYEALALVAKRKTPEGSPPEKEIAALHKEIIQEIAEDRKEELTENGLVDFKVQFKVSREDGREMEVQSQTKQLSEHNLSSLDRRTRDAKGLVNAMIVSDSFTSGEGTSKAVTSTQRMRSGAIDYHDVEVKEGETIILADPFRVNPNFVIKEEEDNLIHQFQVTTDNGTQKEFIEKIRTDMDPKACAVIGLQLLKDDPDNVTGAELLQDALQFQRDAAIVEKNTEMAKGLLNYEHFNTLGHVMPAPVRDILYNPDKPNKPLGVINLQTPVNITGGKGVNKKILSLSRNKKIPSPLRNALKKLAANDISELNNIHRDMRGYNAAKKEAQRECLYFNLPTNFIGRKRSIFPAGFLSIKLRFNTLFNTDAVDKKRADEIKEETLKNLQYVYREANEAIGKLDRALKTMDADSTDYLIILKYKTTLEGLRDQTFDISKKEDQEKIKLKMPPNRDAQFESLARLTVLMERLGMVTKGNCRSGNNRTANWEAKCKQIEGCIAFSDDGKIPEPSVTAARVTGTTSTKDPTTMGESSTHWSLGVFMGSLQSSLRLQKYNKGTEGTKEQVSEFDNSALRGAVLTGAFSLATPFDTEKFQAAIQKQSSPDTEKSNVSLRQRLHALINKPLKRTHSFSTPENQSFQKRRSPTV